MDDLFNLLTDEEIIFINTLSKTYKNRYIDYYTSAKTSKTQDKRLLEIKKAISLELKNIFDVKQDSLKNKIKDLTTLEKFEFYYSSIKERNKLEDIINTLEMEFNLTKHFAWNQPMLVKNDSYIIGFSVAKDHFNIAIDFEIHKLFESEILANNYRLTKHMIQIKWEQEIDVDLIKKMVIIMIEKKKNSKTFW